MLPWVGGRSAGAHDGHAEVPPQRVAVLSALNVTLQPCAGWRSASRAAPNVSSKIAKQVLATSDLVVGWGGNRYALGALVLAQKLAHMHKEAVFQAARPRGLCVCMRKKGSAEGGGGNHAHDGRAGAYIQRAGVAVVGADPTAPPTRAPVTARGARS